MYSYHNTLIEKGKTLDNYEVKAKSQDDMVLAFFMRNAGMQFTPFQVQEICFPHIGFGIGTPITSVRRAITNLEKKGFIKKLEVKKNGVYGRKNHVWVYPAVAKQLTLFP